jgi:hypothetical protein
MRHLGCYDPGLYEPVNGPSMETDDSKLCNRKLWLALKPACVQFSSQTKIGVLYGSLSDQTVL